MLGTVTSRLDPDWRRQPRASLDRECRTGRWCRRRARSRARAPIHWSTRLRATNPLPDATRHRPARSAVPSAQSMRLVYTAALPHTFADIEAPSSLPPFCAAQTRAARGSRRQSRYVTARQSGYPPKAACRADHLGTSAFVRPRLRQPRCAGGIGARAIAGKRHEMQALDERERATSARQKRHATAATDRTRQHG